MEFYRNLYVGDSIKKVNKVKWKLRTGRGQISIYLITLAQNCDQLDIFHSALLKQKSFPKKDLYIVGLANGRKDAIRIVERILSDTMNAGMEADMKGYLTMQIKQDKGGGRWRSY